MSDTTTTPATDAPKGLWARLKRRFGAGRITIPVVRLNGTISPEQRPNRINLHNVDPLLEKAFGFRKAPVVAIVVNSPGGSAVQSRLVSRRIRQLAEENRKKVLVFVEDVAASGGYFIAVGGDEIIADPSSIVGSIGVIFSGFGFVEAIEKLGVERRVHTAGHNKSMLDAFLPEKEEDVERLKTFETDVHDVFIAHVKERRGDRLKAKDEALFTGEWWTAVRGLDMGLVDRIGDLHSVLKERYGENVRLKHIAPRRALIALPRFGLRSADVGPTLASDLIATIEDRFNWSRFGL